MSKTSIRRKYQMNVKNKSTLMSLSTKRGSWIKATKTRKNNN